MKFFPLSALASIALWAAPAAAAPPLEPTGKWVVDFAPSQCTAARDYGTKDKPLALVLKPSAVGSVMTMANVRGGALADIFQRDAALRLDQGPSMPVSLLAFSPPGQKRRVEMINLPLESFALVRQSKTLSIAGKGVSLNFSLAGMIPLMKAMDSCLADLQQVWNVGEKAQARLRRGPMSTNPLRGYFNANDYPGLAIRQEQSGLVEFALLIDETGKVADCTLIKTSGVAALDAQSCAVIKRRGAFLPALGLDGKPVKAATTHRIGWEFP